MPYKIRKLPNKHLYKVYDTKGKSLSYKGMTYKNARKQIIAVHLSKVSRGQPYDVFPRKLKSTRKRNRY
jgi:hypothetical protein